MTKGISFWIVKIIFICVNPIDGKIEVIHLWNGGIAILNIINIFRITELWNGVPMKIINKREALL